MDGASAAAPVPAPNYRVGAGEGSGTPTTDPRIFSRPEHGTCARPRAEMSVLSQQHHSGWPAG
jgi:hypothetical protein